MRLSKWTASFVIYGFDIPIGLLKTYGHWV